MKTLLVAATEKELELIKEKLGKTDSIDFLVSGFGLTATAYSLTKHLQQKDYKLVLNVGIAGSIAKNLALGEVVEVVSEEFADLGAEDKDQFLSVFDLGFLKPNEQPFTEGKLLAKHELNLAELQLKKVAGLSINKVHGNTFSIEKLKQRYSKGVESMEGAACFYVCGMEEVDCMQIRAISNYVTVRNRAAWEIDLALRNLAETVAKLLKQMK
ncbi:MAG: futalosine hydrolase [Vicingaceae bacterium]